MKTADFSRITIFPSKVYSGWISVGLKTDDNVFEMTYPRPANLSDQELAIQMARIMSSMSPQKLYSQESLEGQELLKAFVITRYQNELNRRYNNRMDDPGYCEKVFGEYSQQALAACGRFYPAAEY